MSKKFFGLILFSILYLSIFALFLEDKDKNSNSQTNLRNLRTTADDAKKISIKFDISDSKITIAEEHDIKDLTAKVGDHIFIPESKLKKNGFSFQGWTHDGVYGYGPGDIFKVSAEDMVFKPCFTDSNSKKFYYLEYKAVYNGKEIDTSEYETVGSYKENQIVTTSLKAIPIPGKKAKQRGWTYNDHEFIQGQKLVMPAKDIELMAIFHTYYNMTFYAGDVEGITGKTFDFQEFPESYPKDLPEYTRFSRKGYTNIAWHCEYDDKDYGQFDEYIMPDADVDFYAVWQPIEYTVVFNCGVSGVASIKIKGKTDTTITVPEINTEREGYTFGGWKFNDKVYMPGDDFIIKGQMPGVGISLKAVWEKNDELA